MNATWSQERTYFGQVQVDTWYCALVKGSGKVPFDPGQHKEEQRQTAITITLMPLPGSPVQNPTERGMIANSREWVQIVLPSLKKLGVSLRDLKDQWAQVRMVPTGRTYINSNGEERQATTVQFVAVYKTEAEAQAAAATFFTSRKNGDGEKAPASVPQPAGGNGNGSNSNSAERQTAAKFLPALWKTSGGDIMKFAEKLAATPLVCKHFTIDSPEAVAIISA